MAFVLHAVCIQSSQNNARMCQLFAFLSLDISSKQVPTVDLFRHSLAWYMQSTVYFLIDDALRSDASQLPSKPLCRCRIDLLLNSLFFAFSSLTRLARIDAYSFYKH